MKPAPYPDWLDDVWAKSPVRDKSVGESLAQHTWNVLDKLADLARLRPRLPEQVGVPRLWHRLYYACWLHDLGKASEGFQAMVREGGTAWGRRHEVLSLAFLLWLGFEEEDRLWIAGAIASHHKDPEDIRCYVRDMQALTEMVASVPAFSLAGIWRWISECRQSWLTALGFDATAIEMPPLVPQNQALTMFRDKGADYIVDALYDYLDWADPLSPEYDAAIKTPPIMLRGLIIQADHTASAHAGALKPIVLTADGLVAKWQEEKAEKTEGEFRLYDHQREAGEQRGSALLIAPTGSGKTEAALLWAARQADKEGRLSRLFYTLPYQASMNAMEGRLKKSFPENQVGLQHGRSLLALYRKLMDRVDTKQEASRLAKWTNNLVHLNYHPVRIFSPYAMLKAFYRLKGYEPYLADYYDAAFIFDEIHAYEPKRLALILKSVQHLREYYGAHFLFMTATFPSMIKRKLYEALGEGVPEVVAGTDLFEKFTRHRVHLLEGDLLEIGSLDRVAEVAASGRSVLVCLNTVSRAQQAYNYLGAHPSLAGVEKVLLHGRFNGKDRVAKEGIVRDATGSTSRNRRPVVLVATQVVEVSLDIDLDTIYTDPAPLEALVQRFGRINRRRLQPDFAPVHVYRQPDDGQHVYDADLVQGALGVLEKIDGQPLDEASVGQWLDSIYTGEIEQRWEREYSKSAAEFDRACVQELRGFSTAGDDLEDNFNRLFDGVEVLPAALKSEYIEQVGSGDEIEASMLLVSISYGQLAALNKADKVEWEKDKGSPPVVNARYDEEGLHLND